MFDRDDNLVQSFQLESSHFRGRLARLGSVLNLILHQHAYPHRVAHQLAEAIVIASVLSSSLKYEGVFTLQTKSNGIIRMLVVDVTNDGGIRAYAQYDKDRITEAMDGAGLLGQGYLAFTCSLTGKEDRYQGIVALAGDSLAEAVQHYFRQSEQVPTGIAAAVTCDAKGSWRGGCLLLQRMPRTGGKESIGSTENLFLGSSNFDVESGTAEAEDWTRTMMVMGTCTPEELTDAVLPPNTLLFRLFHEEGVRVYAPQFLRHQCRCSQNRVEAMLRALPRDEISQLIVDGMMTVTCEFCNHTYAFNEHECAQLFKAEAAKQPIETKESL